MKDHTAFLFWFPTQRFALCTVINRGREGGACTEIKTNSHQSPLWTKLGLGSFELSPAQLLTVPCSATEPSAPLERQIQLWFLPGHTRGLGLGSGWMGTGGEMQPTRVIPRGMDPSVPRVRASPDFEFFASFFFIRRFCCKTEIWRGKREKSNQILHCESRN